MAKKQCCILNIYSQINYLKMCLSNSTSKNNDVFSTNNNNNN